MATNKNTTLTAKTTPRTTAPVSSFTALEAPTLAPEFVGILSDQAQQTLYDWLKANAPPDVFVLFREAIVLGIYEQEAQSHDGKVTKDANLSIAESVAFTINAIAAIGGTFSNGYTSSLPRKAGAK